MLGARTAHSGRAALTVGGPDAAGAGDAVLHLARGAPAGPGFTIVGDFLQIRALLRRFLTPTLGSSWSARAAVGRTPSIWSPPLLLIF